MMLARATPGWPLVPGMKVGTVAPTTPGVLATACCTRMNSAFCAGEVISATSCKGPL